MDEPLPKEGILLRAGEDVGNTIAVAQYIDWRIEIVNGDLAVDDWMRASFECDVRGTSRARQQLRASVHRRPARDQRLSPVGRPR